MRHANLEVANKGHNQCMKGQTPLWEIAWFVEGIDDSGQRHQIPTSPVIREIDLKPQQKRVCKKVALQETAIWPSFRRSPVFQFLPKQARMHYLASSTNFDMRSRREAISWIMMDFLGGSWLCAPDIRVPQFSISAIYCATGVANRISSKSPARL